MRQFAYCLPSLAGFAGPKTFAAWPVWSDSTTKTIRFQPFPRKEATNVYPYLRQVDLAVRGSIHGAGVITEVFFTERGYARFHVGLPAPAESRGSSTATQADYGPDRIGCCRVRHRWM